MKFARVGIAVLFAVAPCLAQTGTVTFYSDAYTAKEMAKGLLPTGQGPFYGWLFDGQQRLIHARPGHFVTFRLASGTHAFTVPFSSKQAGKTPLTLDVEDGEHYCIRLYVDFINYEVVPFGMAHSHIAQVSCQVLPQNAGKLKPLEQKWVEAAARSELDPSPTYPTDN